MDSGDWRALSDGRGRRRDAVDCVDNVPRTPGGIVFMEVHREAREGILHSAAALADDGAGRLRFDGSVSVLSVLRSLFGADVLPDWNLGQRKPAVRGDQILSLHAGRLCGHAAGRSEDVFPHPGHRLDWEDHASDARSARRQRQSERDDR